MSCRVTAAVSEVAPDPIITSPFITSLMALQVGRDHHKLADYELHLPQITCFFFFLILGAHSVMGDGASCY